MYDFGTVDNTPTEPGLKYGDKRRALKTDILEIDDTIFFLNNKILQLKKWLQDTMRKSLYCKLLIEVINQIMLLNSHPVADLFKIAIKTVNDELYEIIPRDYEYGVDLV